LRLLLLLFSALGLFWFTGQLGIGGIVLVERVVSTGKARQDANDTGTGAAPRSWIWIALGEPGNKLSSAPFSTGAATATTARE
jgi:hypothetical protein